MPNHITNIVRVEGSREQVEEFMQGVQTEKRLFDFENIIPMPEDIYQGDLGIKEKEKYGEKNWRDRSIENRGTKRNAYSIYRDKYTDIVGDEPGPDGERLHSMTYVFDTARSTPDPIRQKLAEIYKDIRIVVRYADEDIGYNCGRIKIKNGKLKRKLKEGDTKYALEVRSKNRRNRVSSIITEVPKEGTD